MKRIFILFIIIVILAPNIYVFADPPNTDTETDTTKSEGTTETTTTTKSNKDRVVVLDPGHGISTKSSGFDYAANGYIYNSSKGQWGEYRHWESGTYGKECYGNNCCKSHVGGTGDGEWYDQDSYGNRATEPEINLNNALAAKKYLQEMGYTVRMTREDNSTHPSFAKRSTYCFPNNDTTQTPDAELYVCIHSNAGGGSGSAYISATTTYDQAYIPSNFAELCNKAGEIINNKIVENTSLSNYGSGRYDALPDTIAFHKNTCPTAYLEIGFFDNQSELAILRSEADTIGKAIAEGVNEYLQSIEPSINTGSTGNGTVSTTLLKVSGNEEKFLGLWKNATGKYEPYYNDDRTINQDALYDKDGKLVRYGGSGSPVENIFGASDWFFDLLALSERTQNHEQLMRYLMYVYSGRDYGVKEFDFSVFDVTSFKSAGRNSSSQFMEYLKAWEGAAKNAAGNYIVEHNQGDVPTVGYGVAVKYNVERIKSICNYSGDPNTWVKGEELLSKYGITNQQIDKVKEAEANENREDIKKETEGLNLTKQQQDALVAIKYQYGNIGNFVEMYKQYGNTEELRQNVLIPDSYGYKHKVFVEGKYQRIQSQWELKRAAANWKLFHEGIYTDSEGNEIVGGGDFLEVADIVHEYMEQNTYGYCLFGDEQDTSHGGKGGAHGLDSTFEESKSKHQLTCCATYVSWVLYECGYTEFAGIHNCTDLAKLLRAMGASEVSKNDLQAGDICFNGGKHVQIYAGDGTWYNAGGNSSIRIDSPYSDTFGSMTFALRYNF